MRREAPNDIVVGVLDRKGRIVVEELEVFLHKDGWMLLQNMFIDYWSGKKNGNQYVDMTVKG